MKIFVALEGRGERIFAHGGIHRKK